jgi:hypothetical protein
MLAGSLFYGSLLRVTRRRHGPSFTAARASWAAVAREPSIRLLARRNGAARGGTVPAVPHRAGPVTPNDAGGSDTGKPFVELYGTPGTDLTGLFVEGINGSNGAATDSVALSGLIPPDRLFVLADDQGDETTLVEDADLIGRFDFQNGPDFVRSSRAGAPTEGRAVARAARR